MSTTATIDDFYRNKCLGVPDNLEREIGHFNVFRMADLAQHGHKPVRYARRECDRIALSNGHYL